MQKRITTLLTGAAIAFGLSSAVVAQTTPSSAAASPAPATTMQAPAAAYSDGQLQRFISAAQKVAAVSQEYTPKLEAAGDEASRKKVFEEADGKMVKAVHDEGMTVDQFNGISQAAQRDPDLARRLQSIAG